MLRTPAPLVGALDAMERPRNNSGALRVWFALATLPYLINGYINSLIASSTAAYWSFELTTWVAIPLLAFSLARRDCGLTLGHLGFHSQFRNSNGPIVTVILVALFPFADYFVYAKAHHYFSSYLSTSSLFQYGSVMPQTGVGRQLIKAYFAITAGVVEESLYRGAALHLFGRSKRPRLWFMAIAPVLFAAAHWESGLANTAAAYVSGLFSALAFLYFGNIWPLIVGHIYTDYVWWN